VPSYPTLTGGVTIHRPWTREKRYDSVHNDLPHGYRYSFNLRATPLMRFVIEYSALSDADLATLRAFFLARSGSYEPFDFTDSETGITHTKCRFDQEELEVRHIGPNENAVTVEIQEYA
jgi:hypothetical protein